MNKIEKSIRVKIINIINNTEFREKYPIYEKIYKAYDKIFIHLSCNEQCKTNLDLLAKVFSFKEVKDSYDAKVLYVDYNRTCKFIEKHVDPTINNIYHELVKLHDILKEVKSRSISINEIYRKIDMMKSKCEKIDTISLVDKIRLVSLLYEGFVIPYCAECEIQEKTDSLYIYIQGYSDFLFSLLNKLEVNLYAEEQPQDGSV